MGLDCMEQLTPIREAFSRSVTDGISKRKRSGGRTQEVLTHSENRLQRWELAFPAYDLEIEYKKITQFGKADALSKLVAEKKSPDTKKRDDFED